METTGMLIMLTVVLAWECAYWAMERWRHWDEPGTFRRIAVRSHVFGVSMATAAFIVLGVLSGLAGEAGLLLSFRGVVCFLAEVVAFSFVASCSPWIWGDRKKGFKGRRSTSDPDAPG